LIKYSNLTTGKKLFRLIFAHRKIDASFNGWILVLFIKVSVRMAEISKVWDFSFFADSIITGNKIHPGEEVLMT